MNCPICGNDLDSEQCTCDREAVNEMLIYQFRKMLCDRAREREKRKRKEFFDKIKRFFGIKTSASNETDAK